MQINLKNIILVFNLSLLIIHSNEGIAQNFKADYKKVQETYSQMDNFYCEIKIDIYAKANSSKANETLKSVIKKQKNNYWYSLGNDEMLYTDESAIYVNKETKEITYSIRNKKKEITIPNQDVSRLVDSLTKMSDSIVFKGVSESHKKYMIYSSKSVITKAELEINAINNTISKATYYYDTKKNIESEKVVVNYDKIDLNHTFDSNEFSEKMYVKQSNKKVTPLGVFASYKILVIDENDIK